MRNPNEIVHGLTEQPPSRLDHYMMAFLAAEVTRKGVKLSNSTITSAKELAVAAIGAVDAPR